MVVTASIAGWGFTHTGIVLPSPSDAELWQQSRTLGQRVTTLQRFSNKDTAVSNDLQDSLQSHSWLMSEQNQFRITLCVCVCVHSRWHQSLILCSGVLWMYVTCTTLITNITWRPEKGPNEVVATSKSVRDGRPCVRFTVALLGAATKKQEDEKHRGPQTNRNNLFTLTNTSTTIRVHQNVFAGIILNTANNTA